MFSVPSFKYLKSSITEVSSTDEYKQAIIDDKLKEIKNPDRRKRFVVSRILLAKLLKLPLTDLINSDLIKIGEHGKPYLADHRYFFNITDSYDLLAVAICKQVIGIDVEKIRSIDFSHLKRAFDHNEQDLLNKIKDPIIKGKQILKFWTMKEAVLKLVGVGLGGGMSKVSIKDLNHASWQGHDYYLIDLFDSSDYVSSVAFEN